MIARHPRFDRIRTIAGDASTSPTMLLQTTEHLTYLPERDADGKIVWNVDLDWIPQSWKKVPSVEDVPKDLPTPTHTFSSRLPKKNAKRFLCGVCDKQYVRRPDANIHVLEKHIAFYRLHCRKCDFKTSRDHYMKKHIEKTKHQPWNSIEAHRLKVPWQTSQYNTPAKPLAEASSPKMTQSTRTTQLSSIVEVVQLQSERST